MCSPCKGKEYQLASPMPISSGLKGSVSRGRVRGFLNVLLHLAAVLDFFFLIVRVPRGKKGKGMIPDAD